MTRNAKLLAGAIALLLVAGIVAVLAVPLYGVKEDTSGQEVLIAAQLETVRGQLVVLESSLEVQREGVQEARRTRELTEDLLGTAQATLDTAKQALATAEQIRGDVAQIRADTREGLALLREQIALTRELLAVARQTLQEVRAINRKTPPAGSSAPALP